MIKDKRSFQPKSHKVLKVFKVQKDNLRKCPSCEFETLIGMPGGKDSICKNCGYKDPCCYD